MEKETAEMFNRRMDDWLENEKALKAEMPVIPCLRVSNELKAFLARSQVDFEDYILLQYDQDGQRQVNIHIDKSEAIDLAHFIIELFGDKYSPGCFS